MYAIVDLETTGGHPETDRIIEVAIYIHDGNKIVDEYSSLVDPGVEIPPFIARLTGISDAMVSKAPDFSAIAPKIASLLEGNIFVAHNVMFDYSFLMHSLAREGFNFSNHLLCTCKTSRSLLPGHPSYSLGRLCRSLSIELKDAHRAAADAKATAYLLDLLIEKTNGVLSPFFYVKEKKQNRSRIPNEQVEKLPHKAGVLYFLDEAGKIIYLVKSKNIRKKAWSVIGKFTNKRYAAVATLTTSIDYLVTGSQLVASIKEGEDIMALQPRYNRKFKVYETRYSIFEHLSKRGYLYLDAAVYDKSKNPIITFSNQQEAKKVLTEIEAEFELLNSKSIDNTGVNLFTDSPDLYNEKVVKAIENLTGKRKNFIITDAGPETGSLSLVVIRNGVYAGYLHTSNSQSLTNVEEVLENMQPSEDHPLAFKSIVKFVSQGNYRNIIHF
jgi:DNA polymerase III subunit epsilon